MRCDADGEEGEVAVQRRQGAVALRRTPDRAAEVAQLDREQRRVRAADGHEGVDRLTGHDVEQRSVADARHRLRRVHVQLQQVGRRDRGEGVHRRAERAQRREQLRRRGLVAQVGHLHDHEGLPAQGRRDVLEGRARRNPAVRIALVRVVDETAGAADPELLDAYVAHRAG